MREVDIGRFCVDIGTANQSRWTAARNDAQLTCDADFASLLLDHWYQCKNGFAVSQVPQRKERKEVSPEDTGKGFNTGVPVDDSNIGDTLTQGNSSLAGPEQSTTDALLPETLKPVALIKSEHAEPNIHVEYALCDDASHEYELCDDTPHEYATGDTPVHLPGHLVKTEPGDPTVHDISVDTSSRSFHNSISIPWQSHSESGEGTDRNVENVSSGRKQGPVEPVDFKNQHGSCDRISMIIRKSNSGKVQILKLPSTGQLKQLQKSEDRTKNMYDSNLSTKHSGKELTAYMLRDTDSACGTSSLDSRVPVICVNHALPSVQEKLGQTSDKDIQERLSDDGERAAPARSRQVRRGRNAEDTIDRDSKNCPELQPVLDQDAAKPEKQTPFGRHRSKHQRVETQASPGRSKRPKVSTTNGQPTQSCGKAVATGTDDNDADRDAPSSQADSASDLEDIDTTYDGSVDALGGVFLYRPPDVNPAYTNWKPLPEDYKGHVSFGKERFFPCDRCSKSRLIAAYLKMHYRQHADPKERTGYCVYCRTSLYPFEEKFHKLCAASVCPYQGCQAELNCRQRYQQHMQKHRQMEKCRNQKKVYQPAVCPVCGKQFKRNCGLKEHLRIHTGEKPHICYHCGDAFTQKASWNYHMTKRHPEDTSWQQAKKPSSVLC